MISEKSIVIKTLKKYQIHPSKSLGQNFLIDRGVLDRLIEEAKLTNLDPVLEVGPGLGVLTKELAQRAKKVVAVELSGKLAKACQKECQNFTNIKIINQDILQLDLAKLSLGQNYKVVSSLPYQITSPFLRKLIDADQGPKLIVLLVQKELAERIAAQPGDSNRGFLSVLIQLFYQSEIARGVAGESFYPVPRVESAILKLIPVQENYPVKDLSEFSKFLQAGFGHKRKKLTNSLSLNLSLNKEKIIEAVESCGLEDNIRAESLTIENWIELDRSINAKSAKVDLLGSER